MDSSILKKAFKGNLIEELGLGILPEAQKANLVASLSELIGMRLMLRVTDALPAAEQEAFLKLIQDKPAEEIFTWLDGKHVPFDEMLAEEIARAKEDARKWAEKK